LAGEIYGFENALNKLRKDTIERLARKPGRHSDGGGLFLQVAKRGQASWVYQFCLRGKARWMSIGPLSVLNIDKARKLHQELRAQVWSGVDPIEARGGRWGSHKVGSPEQRRETKSNYPTFKKAAEDYLKAKGPRLNDKGEIVGDWGVRKIGTIALGSRSSPIPRSATSRAINSRAPIS
jgi:hypothetical protein